MDIDYKNYYRDKDYEKYESLFRNIFSKRLNLINKYVAHRGRVLDIGCSNGIFLDLLKEKGWETWGIEPSQNSSLAKEKGHKVIKESFENVNLPKNYFDLVIMNHTLEHLDNPTAILNKVKSILKNKGILFVDVPNAGGLGSKILGEKWPYRLPKEHKWQFKRDSLEKLFRETGFDILAFDSRSGIFEYANPLLELHRKRFLLDIISIPYSLVATLMNLGDSMSIIGKNRK